MAIWIPYYWYGANDYRYAQDPGNSFSAYIAPFWEWTLWWGVPGSICGIYTSVFGWREHLNEDNEHFRQALKDTESSDVGCCMKPRCNEKCSGLSFLSYGALTTWTAAMACGPEIGAFPLGGDSSPYHYLFAYTQAGLMTLSMFLFAILVCVVPKTKNSSVGGCFSKIWFSLLAVIAVGFIALNGYYMIDGSMIDIKLSQADCIAESPHTETETGVCTGPRTHLSGKRHCANMDLSYDAYNTLCNVHIDEELTDEAAKALCKEHQCDLIMGLQTAFKKPKGKCEHSDKNLRGPNDPCAKASARGEVREDGSRSFLTGAEFGQNCSDIDANCDFTPPSVSEAYWKVWTTYQPIALASYFLFGISISFLLCKCLRGLCGKATKADPAEVVA